MASIICPYCRNPAELVDSAIVYGKSYGMIWDCRACDAYVGTHKNSPNHAPLGRLANKELREWKKLAHAAFDPLWTSKHRKYTRKQAYKWMQDAMGISLEEAHIGKFDVDKCKQLVELLRGK